MGIFRFLGNKCGEFIEWVGDKTGLDIFTDVGIRIQVACNFGQSQWDSNSTADDTAEVHKRLDQFKEQIAPQAQAKEQVLINQCVEKITKLLFLFQGVFSEQKISYLKRIYREEIAQTLSGSIIQYIEPRLSFENEHCKEILRKPDGVRQRSANEYQDQLLKEAELFFLEECRKVSIKHIRRVQDDVRAELNVLEKDYNDKMAMLTKRQEEAQDENQIDLERASLAILQMELTMLADFASQS